MIVTLGCVYAQLLSGYSGTGFGGMTVRNDASLRLVLGLVAIVALAGSILLSLWAFRLSTGLARTVPAGTLLISLGMVTFAILGRIF